jgi:hypothetical protein
MEVRGEVHTLAILIQRNNVDGRVFASQSEAECIEGEKKILVPVGN